MKPARSAQEIERKLPVPRAAPVKARAAALAADRSVNDAFKAVLWANLAHLQANERGMLEGRDPEYLHQMRVALRRMRAAFSVFAPLFPEAVTAPLVAELKWLAGALGPARDWDVFVTETLPAIAADSGEHAQLGALGKRCARLRRAAHRRAHGAVASKRHQRLMLSLAGWLAAEAWLTRMDEAARARLAGPARGFAGVVLEKRYAQVRKRGRKLAQLDASELHRLRIAVKKFRYATDFFAGLYRARRVREMRERLVRLQNILGAMNDAATVENMTGTVFRGAGNRSAKKARDILLAWSRGRAATLKRELKGAWKEFRSAEKFW